MFIIVLGQHVSILIESSPGPSKKQILTQQCLKCAVGYMFIYIYVCVEHFGMANIKKKLKSIWGGLRIETQGRPN